MISADLLTLDFSTVLHFTRLERNLSNLRFAWKLTSLAFDTDFAVFYGFQLHCFCTAVRHLPKDLTWASYDVMT